MSDHDLQLCSVTHQLVANRELDKLFERYAERVRAWANTLTDAEARQHGDVDDLAQETLLHAVKSLEQLKYDRPGAFCRWISQILRNRIVDHRRARHARPEAPEDPVDSCHQAAAPSVGPADAALHTEEVEGLRRALRDLPSKFRRVLEMRFLEGAQLKEVAAREESNVPTVHRWEKKGLELLRLALIGWGREATHRLPRSSDEDMQTKP